MEYTVPPLRGVETAADIAMCQQMVQTLVVAGAIPGWGDEQLVLRGDTDVSWQLLHGTLAAQDQLRALEALSKADLVECNFLGTSRSSWVLTRLAISTMSLIVRVKFRSLTFGELSVALPESMTKWELLLHLHQCGWQHRMLPKRPRKADLAKVKPFKPLVGELVWWTRSSSGPSRSYLLVLAKAAEVLAPIGMEHVVHLQPE